MDKEDHYSAPGLHACQQFRAQQDREDTLEPESAQAHPATFSGTDTATYTSTGKQSKG